MVSIISHKLPVGGSLAVLGALAVGTAAISTPPPAAADMAYDFSYTASGISASGQFTTSNTAIASGAYAGGYPMLTMTGQRNGITITGLLDPAAAGTYVSMDSTGFDNVFYPVPSSSKYQYFDSVAGIAYTTTQSNQSSGGYVYNIYSNGTSPVTYSEYQGYVPSTKGGPINTLTSLTITAVPEPAALAVLLLGGLGIFLLPRRQRARGPDGRGGTSLCGNGSTALQRGLS